MKLWHWFALLGGLLFVGWWLAQRPAEAAAPGYTGVSGGLHPTAVAPGEAFSPMAVGPYV